jgi:hypothetical protein
MDFIAYVKDVEALRKKVNINGTIILRSLPPHDE